MNKSLLLAASLGCLLSAQTANATINVVFDNINTGVTSFNNTVTGAGATPVSQVLTPGGTSTFTDFTITKNGAPATIGNIYTLSGSSPTTTTSGGMVNINVPSSGAVELSGLTLTFANPINALGFEVGDWGTCCLPSNLYIQFGNNTPIQVGSSTVSGDVRLTNNGYGVFVAAFDDTSTFTTVTFWGDGRGEVLWAGGTIRYSTVAQNSLPPSAPSGAVPEPATWAMMIAGMGLVGASLRRRSQANVRFAI